MFEDPRKGGTIIGIRVGGAIVGRHGGGCDTRIEKVLGAFGVAPQP